MCPARWLVRDGRERLADRPALRPDQKVDVSDLIAIADQGLAHRKRTCHTRLSSVDSTGRRTNSRQPSMPVSCPAASYTMPRMEVKEARRPGASVAGAAAQLACVLEASAEKPGNITPSHDFADTSYEDMLRSAIALGPELGRAAERGVGETVLAAVRATQRVAGANTNLGIALLLAPLARAALLGGPLRERAEEVLGALTLDDARAAYAAIRTAGAGGLDEPVEHDVRDEPTLALRDAMAAAAERDSVAVGVRDRLRPDLRRRAAGADARARRRARPAPRDGRALPGPARRGPGHADRAQAGSRGGRAGLGRRGPRSLAGRGRQPRGVRRLAAAWTATRSTPARPRTS